MRRDVSLLVALSMTTLWHAGLAQAFTTPVSGPTKSVSTLTKSNAPAVGIHVIRPKLVPDSGKSAAFASFKAKSGAHLQADQVSGAVRVLSGGLLSDAAPVKSVRSATDYVALATQFVADHKDMLGVDPQDLVLNRDALLLDKDLQLVKFGIVRDGLSVQDGNIDFRFKRGKLVQVINQSFAEARADMRPGLSGLEQTVEKHLNTDKVTATGELFRVRETNKGYELVRVLRFDAVTPADTYSVQVEAATGRIFEIRARKFMLDGTVSGQVHARYYADPLAVQPFELTTLSYQGGKITADAAGKFFGAPDGSEPKIDGLEGSHVKTIAKSGDKLTATGAPARDLWDIVFQKTGTTASNADKVVAQAMVYYHVNKEIDRVKTWISNPWMDKQLVANVNLSSTCNAYWDGETINMFSAGDGCANTGTIADVMYHEWGHGLDANTGGIDDSGFSEGFGDIMSIVMTRSSILGIGFMNDGSPVRNLEPDKVYPRDQSSEPHADGLIIGSTFWDLFKALTAVYGEDQADEMLGNYATKAIVAATRYTDVYEALLVIDDNDGDLNNGTPNSCLINKVFAEHGLATADTSCDLARLGTLEVDDRDNGNGNGILEPGETAKLWATADNIAATDLSVLSGTLAITGNPGVSVTDPTLAWGPIAAHTSVRSSQPATVSVASDVACGSTVHAKVKLESGARVALADQDLMIGRIDGHADALTASDLPKPIRDLQTTTATVKIDGGQWTPTTTVYAARLSFDINHSYVGDLSVKLTSPSGHSTSIWKGSGSGHDAHYNQDVTELLKGETGQGEWTLKVTDDAADDQGSLTAMTLTLTPANFLCQ